MERKGGSHESPEELRDLSSPSRLLLEGQFMAFLSAAGTRGTTTTLFACILYRTKVARPIMTKPKPAKPATPETPTPAPPQGGGKGTTNTDPNENAGAASSEAPAADEEPMDTEKPETA